MGNPVIMLDLDGTLVQTEPQYTLKLLNEILWDLRLPRATPEQARLFFYGKNRDKIVAEQFGADPKEFWEVYDTHDTEDLKRPYVTAYYDVSALQDLKDDGYRLGLVTGAMPQVSDMEIELVGPELFDAIVIANKRLGFGEYKPHPWGIHECKRRMNTNGNPIIYVGNGDEDVECALRAGALDVLIDRGEHQFPDLEPTHKINSLYDLADLVRQEDLFR